ncbi:MAG: inositol monophosphatase [Oscillospiraceae bacterium]|nr:inositol monophosphatase [Oscillospiraceae bacterium]
MVYCTGKEMNAKMELSNREILERMCAAEREAGELLLHAQGVLAECKTGHRDVVTQYDRRVQELLIRRFTELLPDARFFCEENDRHDDLHAAHVFIIDPIDGTMNFVRGFNHSCISAAFMRDGVVCAAAVYNPYVNELFSAVLGEGAWLNGRPIHVTDAPLSESVVCVGTAPYNVELADRTFALAKAAFLAGLDIRRQGSAELDLCSVAAGRAGVYFELRLALWDYAAGMLIVQEAGGDCLTPEGNPLPLGPEKRPVAAGGKQTLAEFLAMAKELV